MLSNSYISTLSYNTVELIDAPVPYFIGCPSKFLDQLEIPDDVIVVDLDERKMFGKTDPEIEKSVYVKELRRMLSENYSHLRLEAAVKERNYM